MGYMSRRAAATILAAVIVASIPAAAQGGNQNTAFPNIVIKSLAQMSIPDYGSQITIFEASNSAAQGDRQRFAFMPTPILDEDALQKTFADLTTSLSSDQKNSPLPVSISLHWTYQLVQTKKLIAAELSKRPEFKAAPVYESDILTVPLNSFSVYALINNKEYPLEVMPDPAAGVQIPPNLADPDGGTLTAPYPVIAAFAQQPAIGARGYVTTADVQTTAISISGTVLSSEDFLNQVSGPANFSQTMNSTSSSGGVGLALPVLGGIFGGGSSGSSASESSQINRFVSRNFVQHALESGGETLSIHEWTDAHSGTTPDSIVTQLVTFALNAMNHTTARFEQQADRTYKLHSDDLNSDLGTSLTLSQIAAATNGSSNFDSSLNNDIKAGNVSASDAAKLTNNGSSDISWSAQGNIAVPSTVDLYYATSDQFKANLDEEYVTEQANYAQTTIDIKARVTASVPSVPLDPGIGTIVASAVPWEAQTAEFREHWIPADGRAVPESSQYFKLMVATLPANPGQSPQIKVPDLRGQFLRGLNNFDSSVAASSVDPFDRENGRARKVGEVESSAIQKQNLQVDTQNKLHNFQHGGNSNDGDHIRLPADHPGDWMQLGIILDPNVNYSPFETRPTNIAIFYYIRIN